MAQFSGWISKFGLDWTLNSVSVLDLLLKEDFESWTAQCMWLMRLLGL